ncbi:MAG: imidazole glycerol phosphate synthase subunit HisH [Shewanella sp.]
MSIVILDTGCANLASVKYAIQRLGYQPKVSNDPQQVLTARKVLLPGVGTAKAAMEQLTQRHLIELIQACTQPVLGICLGMQLLASHSEEGNVNTLGIVDAPIKRMKNHGLPLPHMGWNQVSPQAGNPLFKNIADNSYFYFVHGFALSLCHATIAETEYGEKFSAAIQQDNFFGVQFHPERSGKAGAQLLKNFLEM